MYVLVMINIPKSCGNLSRMVGVVRGGACSVGLNFGTTAGTSMFRREELRYSASTRMEKRMEPRPAAMTGSMLDRSSSRRKAWES